MGKGVLDARSCYTSPEKYSSRSRQLNNRSTSHSHVHTKLALQSWLVLGRCVLPGKEPGEKLRCLEKVLEASLHTPGGNRWSQSSLGHNMS